MCRERGKGNAPGELGKVGEGKRLRRVLNERDEKKEKRRMTGAGSKYQ